VTYLHNFLTRTLTSVAQVCLQDSPVTGAFFLLAIALYSPLYAILALAGAVVANTYAQSKVVSGTLKEADIQNGLYGFNGTLIGISVAAFLPVNGLSLLFMGLACVFSVQLVIWVAQRSQVSLFTMPFIVVAMFVYGLGQSLNVSGALVSPMFNQSYALPLFEGIGQIFLLPNAMSGVCILLGFLVASVRGFFITLWSVGLAYFLAQEVGMNDQAINSGLFGFCAILTAHALCLPSTTPNQNQSHFLPYKIVLGVVLSVLFTQLFILAHLSFFTLPFVLSVWALQILGRIPVAKVSGYLKRGRA
jgi:urea transporter